jgi:hypothetical protein
MLISFLLLLLHCAVIILFAYLILWLLKFVGIAVDGEVYKWGRIVVVLLIVIAVVAWLLGVAPVPFLLGHY